MPGQTEGLLEGRQMERELIRLREEVERLREENARYRLMVDSSPALIAFVDIEGR